MAALATSSISVLRVGPSVGVTAGWGVEDELAGFVGDGKGEFVGKGVVVGNIASVAVASGEQAANPLTTPSAPIFKASLREILLILFIDIPLKQARETYW